MADGLGGSDDVAERLRRERVQRGLSYRVLADLMNQALKDAGSTRRVDGAALQRIENGAAPGKPRPKIGVDELVAMCRVFGIEPTDMITDIELVRTREARALVKRHDASVAALVDHVLALVSVWRDTAELPHDEMQFVARHMQKAYVSEDQRLAKFGDEVVSAFANLTAAVGFVGNELANEIARQKAPIGAMVPRYPTNPQWTAEMQKNFGTPSTWAELAAELGWLNGRTLRLVLLDEADLDPSESLARKTGYREIATKGSAS